MEISKVPLSSLLKPDMPCLMHIKLRSTTITKHSREVGSVRLDFFANMLGEKAEKAHGNQNHVEDAPRILQ